MMTDKQAAYLSGRVIFYVVDYNDKDKFNMSNVVVGMPVRQLLDKLKMAEPDWYMFARLDCEG